LGHQSAAVIFFMARILVFLLLAAGASGSLGCGSGGGDRSHEDASGVRATERAFLTDMRDGRFGDACALMTPAALAEVRQQNEADPSTDCSSLMALVQGFTGKEKLDSWVSQVDSLPVTVNGDHATVALSNGGNTTEMVYVDGHWMINNS
jgi:hypothetical protein